MCSQEVTLALLSSKQDQMLEEVGAVRRIIEGQEARARLRDQEIAGLKTACALFGQWQDGHKERHDHDNVVLKTWSVVSGAVGAAVGAVVAVVRGLVSP